ncbi:MAG TPA: alpha/beta hydrolase [Mycobacterium sp.]|nr:alpha/beta hydrolase [Mycobacterium sp.]
MDVTDRLDPALRYATTTRTNLSPDLLPVVRAGLDERRAAAAQLLATDDLEISDTVTSAGTPVRIYRPGGVVTQPAVVFCHSGAFVLGNLDTDHRLCVELARRAQCTVISVDYRLAPEHPYPAALDDVEASLEWVIGDAAGLGIDPARVAIAGSSAGGALAAAVAQRSRTGTLPPLVFQLLHQPVLDHRPSPSKEEFTATPGFDGPACEQMWEYYLQGGRSSPAAAPGMAEAVEGLAPALITCSELDPLRDEAIDYALRLMWAGVAAELHVFPGTCHGFDALLPEWEVSQRLFAMQAAALRRAFDTIE